jgi:hypothetical protein
MIKRESLDFVVAIVLAFVALISVVYYNYTHPRIVVRYDCSIAEISPDYPIQVKEGCRKLRAENILNKPK